MTQHTGELLAGPDQPVVIGVALSSPLQRVTQALLEKIQTRQARVDRREQVALSKPLRYGFGQRRRLEGDHRRARAKPYNLDHSRARQPAGNLPSRRAPALDTKAHGLLAS